MNAGELDQIRQLVVVESPDHDRIELEPSEARPLRRDDTLEHVGVPRALREREHALGAQRVEAHGRPLQARRPQGGGVLCEEHPVRGQGEVTNPRVAGDHLDQGGEVVPQQRLPAGEPDLVHPQPGEHAHQPRDLLEREDRLARQPDIVVLGHAVAAPHVAAVGDRDPQARERATERVAEQVRHGRVS